MLMNPREALLRIFEKLVGQECGSFEPGKTWVLKGQYSLPGTSTELRICIVNLRGINGIGGTTCLALHYDYPNGGGEVMNLKTGDDLRVGKVEFCTRGVTLAPADPSLLVCGQVLIEFNRLVSGPNGVVQIFTPQD